VADDGVWERVDVEAIVTGIFDIKALLAEVVGLLGEDDDEEEDEGSEGP
jgi:hypothetical protein